MLYMAEDLRLTPEATSTEQYGNVHLQRQIYHEGFLVSYPSQSSRPVRDTNSKIRHRSPENLKNSAQCW